MPFLKEPILHCLLYLNNYIFFSKSSILTYILKKKYFWCHILDKKQLIFSVKNFYDKSTSNIFNKTTYLNKTFLNIHKIILYKNKSYDFFNDIVCTYRVKRNKYVKFTYNYMWTRIWRKHSFWISSYSNFSYAWLSIRSTRSNFFGTFYHTGMLTRFKNPEGIDSLNNKFNLKIASSENFKLPYRLHPYVSASKSPFYYIWATCSSGMFRYKKKAKRATKVLDFFKDYYDVYFNYYFKSYETDFFFYKINGFTRAAVFFKKKIINPMRKAKTAIKRSLRYVKKLRKQLKKRQNQVHYPVLYKFFQNVIAQRNLPAEQASIEHKNVMTNLTKSRLHNARSTPRIDAIVNNIIEYVSKFPKFFYILNVTSYAFNGCKRVRHYK